MIDTITPAAIAGALEEQRAALADAEHELAALDQQAAATAELATAARADVALGTTPRGAAQEAIATAEGSARNADEQRRRVQALRATVAELERRHAEAQELEDGAEQEQLAVEFEAAARRFEAIAGELEAAWDVLADLVRRDRDIAARRSAQAGRGVDGRWAFERLRAPVDLYPARPELRHIREVAEQRRLETPATHPKAAA